jgi:hypothetical protein
MRVPTKFLLALAAVAVAGTVHAQKVHAPIVIYPGDETPVFVRVDQLPTHLADRIEREAAKGLKPLRDYVQRTKFMHQLDLVALLMTREQARIALRDEKVRLVRIASTE